MADFYGVVTAWDIDQHTGDPHIVVTIDLGVLDRDILDSQIPTEDTQVRVTTAPARGDTPAD